MEEMEGIDDRWTEGLVVGALYVGCALPGTGRCYLLQQAGKSNCATNIDLRVDYRTDLVGSSRRRHPNFPAYVLQIFDAHGCQPGSWSSLACIDAVNHKLLTIQVISCTVAPTD